MIHNFLWYLGLVPCPTQRSSTKTATCRWSGTPSLRHNSTFYTFSGSYLNMTCDKEKHLHNGQSMGGEASSLNHRALFVKGHLPLSLRERGKLTSWHPQDGGSDNPLWETNQSWHKFYHKNVCGTKGNFPNTQGHGGGEEWKITACTCLSASPATTPKWSFLWRHAHHVLFPGNHSVGGQVLVSLFSSSLSTNHTCLSPNF